MNVSGAVLLGTGWLDAIVGAPLWLCGAAFTVFLLALLISKSHLQAILASFILVMLFVPTGRLETPAIFNQAGETTQFANPIEMRMAMRRTQVTGQPVIACVETKLNDDIDAACERALFSRPEHLAAATAYVRQGLNLLKDSQEYAAARGLPLAAEFERLRTLLEQDRFGLVANLLIREENCTIGNCKELLLFSDSANVQANMVQHTFQMRVTQHFHHAHALREPSSVAAASLSESRVAPSLVAAPVPPKYVLPSSNSIPPISIMNEEPIDGQSTRRFSSRRPSKDAMQTTDPSNSLVPDRLKPLILTQ